MIRTICSQHQNQSWFLQHKDQLLQAGLDVNAKDYRRLTVLENILASESYEMEMALQMAVNPELRDGEGLERNFTIIKLAFKHMILWSSE